MPRIYAEEIDFEAYFADCQAHEPVSQRWKPFHRLPPQSGSGCYMLLADFGAATRNKQPPYSGMYAFYFGRSDVAFTEKGEKSEGLKSRGNTYFVKKDRAPNNLRKALMDEGAIPTILMCSQIEVSEGKGVLEAVMLHRYDFFTNGTYNGGVRPMKEGETSLVDSFRQACMKVKIQKPIEHRKFFASIQKDLTDASLRNAVLMNSRSVSVRVQEAYAAVAAAEASPNLSTNSGELLGQQRRRLQGRLCIMLEQLKEAEAEVENVAAMLQGNIDACYHYYNDVPPITQPRGKSGRLSQGTYAYQAALAVEKAQEAAWAAAKSDQPTATPSAASQATKLGIAVATPLPTAHRKKGGAVAQAPSSSMRQTRRMTAAQQQRTSSPGPEVPCSKSFVMICKCRSCSVATLG